MANTKPAQAKLELTVEPRTVTGKKVKQMRKKGLIPGNVFGPNFKSVAITVPLKELLTAYKTAKNTGIVYLMVEGKSLPTLIKWMQKHPVTDEILHVDFRKIDLKQKIETTVPVAVVGESVAVTQLGGVLLTQANDLMIEALPESIPSQIEVDITAITELGQEIKVKDLAANKDYVIKEEPEKVIVSVVAHKEESTIAETETVAPDITTEKKAEGEEGAQGAAESEAPKEEGKE